MTDLDIAFCLGIVLGALGMAMAIMLALRMIAMIGVTEENGNDRELFTGIPLRRDDWSVRGYRGIGPRT